MNLKRCILISALALGLALVVGASTTPVAVNLTPSLSLDCPFQKVSATELYSWHEGKGYPAVETVLLDWQGHKGIPISTLQGKFNITEIQLTFGAAPVIGTSANVPFLAIQTRLPTSLFDISNNSLMFGIWGGHESDKGRHGWIYGIKSSIPLF